jgi:hypothetical protein
MVSNYHYVRHTKWATESEDKIKGSGRKTYGYDFGNDGYRRVVEYKIIQKWVESKVGEAFDDVWSEACKLYDSRTYVGKQTLDYISYLLEFSKYSDYYLDNGIIKKRPKTVYKYPKRKSSIVYHSGQAYHRHDNIWYAVSVKTPAKNTKSGTYYIEDVFLGLLTGHSWIVERQLRSKYGSLIYCISKKQVSRRVCKHLNSLVAKGN